MKVYSAGSRCMGLLFTFVLLVFLLPMLFSEYSEYCAAKDAEQLRALLLLAFIIAAFIIALFVMRYEHFGSLTLDSNGVRQSIFGIKRYSIAWRDIKEIGVKVTKGRNGKSYYLYFSDKPLKPEQRELLALKRRVKGFVKFSISSEDVHDEALSFINKHYDGKILNACETIFDETED